MNGQNEPTDREEWIKICFALEFNELQATQFMAFSLDGGFHLRNPREIAYLYCIRTHKTYQESMRFVNRLKPLVVKVESEPILNFGTISTQDQYKHMIYTKVVGNAFAKVHDDDSFFRFYKENYSNFGHLHNTAYVRFMHFFNELIQPSVPVHTKPEESYSIEQAVDTYLRMNLPLDRRTGKYTVVQKAIRSFWPNITTIKNFRRRREDVSRKVLLLLYVVTEGFDAEVTDEDLYLEELTPSELLEAHAWRINLMLHDCGMGMLDPRNPFDWLLLYSLKTNDDDKGMGERLQEVLNILFP